MGNPPHSAERYTGSIPLGELVATIPDDPIAGVTALKTAEAILRAGFAGR